MDDQSELERLGKTCADLKKTIEEDIRTRKAQDTSGKWWQITTIVMPILVTAAVGWMLHSGQANLQESIASSEEFYTHRLAQYEDLDNRAISLQESIGALSNASQDGSSQGGDALNAAVDALSKFKDPLTRLYFDTDFDAPVSTIIDLASNSKYLGGSSDTSATLVAGVQDLEQLMLKKLGTK